MKNKTAVIVSVGENPYFIRKDIADSLIRVTFDSGDIVDVQMNACEYKPSLGAIVTLNDEEDYDDSKQDLIDKAIEAAEKHEKERIKKGFTGVELPFNCSMNNTSYLLLIDNDDGAAHLISEGHYNDDYSPAFGVIKSFIDKEEALQFINGFKTNEHHDFKGLNDMLNSIAAY